jgi:hypothetical protein
MEYEIHFESRETFLKKLKNVEDIEKNLLFIWNNGIGIIDINFIINELLKYKKIRLGLQFIDSNLTIIPKTIHSLENLMFLNLSGNNIDYIPINICKLKKLHTLFIHCKKNPYVICDLQNLECIYTDIEPHKKNKIIFYKKKRLIFRLYFLIHKSYIF